MKRGRNQRRRQGMNINRALDSNGPDVRIRGTANQIYDKYLALARDASSSGDRVKAENYLQHAEHYFRLIRSIQPTLPLQSDAMDADGEQPGIGDGGDRERRPDQGGEAEEAASAEPESGGQNEARHFGNGSADHRGAPNENDGDSRRGRRRRPRRPHQGESAPAAAQDDEEPVDAGSV